MSWIVCQECKGRGKKSQRLRKKVRLLFQNAIAHHKNTNQQDAEPTSPKAPLIICTSCAGSGLTSGENQQKIGTENLPHVAIIGAGIGGVALAVACLHRGIPFTLFERDNSFDARAQGYGLTLQQASKAMAAFGVQTLADGIISTKHIVHDTAGNIIGEWGMRKWLETENKKNAKRTNIHISRQSLRLALLAQLGGMQHVQWSHQLIGFTQLENNNIALQFEVNGALKNMETNLLVGADGIRSAVRNILINEAVTPLRYLGCIVILGICPLANLAAMQNTLLDGATVFQTVNGNERIYMMPYDAETIMWQMSFPMLEEEAKTLSQQGALALQQEACKRAQWHEPIPQILAATLPANITGYPVYDRDLLHESHFKNFGNTTLLGDAAHPMSPFKGQGANQALLDALSLARNIFHTCHPFSDWRETGLRKIVLLDFEKEMLERCAVKVKDSADAVAVLHSEMVMQTGDTPRGRILKK